MPPMPPPVSVEVKLMVAMIPEVAVTPPLMVIRPLPPASAAVVISKLSSSPEDDKRRFVEPV